MFEKTFKPSMRVPTYQEAVFEISDKDNVQLEIEVMK